jgi:hypothetical protein
VVNSDESAANFVRQSIFVVWSPWHVKHSETGDFKVIQAWPDCFCMSQPVLESACSIGFRDDLKLTSYVVWICGNQHRPSPGWSIICRLNASEEPMGITMYGFQVQSVYSAQSVCAFVIVNDFWGMGNHDS